MHQTIQELQLLQEILIKLGEVERPDYWPGSSRLHNETSAEHTLFLAFFCWQVEYKLKLGLDHETILKYALVHDLTNVGTTDTPPETDAKMDAPANQDEPAAVNDLATRLPDSDIPMLIQAYENRVDDESKFVAAMDVLVALLVQICSRETPFLKNKVTIEEVQDTLPELRRITDINAELTELTDTLLRIWFDSVALYEPER